MASGRKSNVPTYSANLFKESPKVQRPKTPVAYTPRDKPLMTLRVDLGDRVGMHLVSVYKDDVNGS
jgi:hypothetical protein